MVSKTIVLRSSRSGPVDIQYKKMKLIRNITTELKQTEWPSMDQLVKLTIYTLILCGIIALLILGVDIVLFWLRDLWLGEQESEISHLILNI